MSGDATLASSTGDPNDAPLVLRPGDRIGRYRVDAEIGSGAQGIVVRATDLELGRSLAIKVIRNAEPRARERMLREARALAALEHPNVVRVFDVGEHRGRVFVAMEYIDGWNLGQWWADDRIDRDRRVGALCQAGRGLAAAHAAGLVHRDFKPANVLVARDGRVVVTDFGLVLDQDNSEPRLTDRNLRIGTPGYMAPEQLLGNEIAASSDQFAFCVSLFEATYRTRPFKGHNVAELVGAMAQRVAKAPANGRRAPGWLRRVIERGLDPDPARRFASMTALLDALDAGPGRSRRLALAAVAVAVVVIAAFAVPKTSPVTAMPAAFDRLAEVPAILDAPQSAWTQARVQHALADVDFALGTGKIVEAREGAERIRVAAVAAGDDSLAGWALGQRGWAELGLRDSAAARITFTSLVEQSQRRGDDVQLTYAALGMLEIDREEGQHERALRWADEAEAAASRAAMPIDIIISLQISRATIAYARGDLETAEIGFREALDLSDDSVPGIRAQALMLNNLGAIQGRRQQFEQAAVLLAESAQLYAELVPDDDLDLVAVETNLGLNLVKAGDTAGGIDLVYAALARVQRTHVAPDPALADTHLIVADTLFEANDSRACLRHATAALAMIDRVEAPARVQVGAPHRVCVCALRLGDIADAEAAGARAVTLLETVDVDPTLATATRFAYAKAAAAAGRTQIARRVAARAVETSPDPSTTREITAWVAGL